MWYLSFQFVEVDNANSPHLPPLTLISAYGLVFQYSDHGLVTQHSTTIWIADHSVINIPTVVCAFKVAVVSKRRNKQEQKSFKACLFRQRRYIVVIKLALWLGHFIFYNTIDNKNLRLVQHFCLCGLTTYLLFKWFKVPIHFEWLLKFFPKR